MWNRCFAVTGALLAGLGVAMGAYHAHGLEAWLTNNYPDSVDVLHRLENAAIAIRYQMYHALALLVLGTIFAVKPRRILAVGCAFLCLGLLLFSGGLYVIVFAGTAIHWAIVPLGGLLLILGWLITAIALCLSIPSPNTERA